MQFHNVSQSEIDSAISILAEKIKRTGIKYNKVIGIHSGGLPISVPLSKLLNIEHQQIRISFYGEQDTPKETPEVNMFGNILSKEDKYLFVDDLTDSCSTFNYISNNINNNSHYCCIYHNLKNKFNFEPNYFYQLKPDAWINFPWDSK